MILFSLGLLMACIILYLIDDEETATTPPFQGTSPYCDYAYSCDACGGSGCECCHGPRCTCGPQS